VGSGAFDINNAGVLEEVAWIKELATELNVGLVDMNAAFAGKSNLLPDKVHPNAEGATLLASAAYSALTGKEPTAADKPDRLAWWREARFGMFIHWGVYSALAGEWKGQKVEGYAEHIQRIAKIKRETYLEEVVKPFNPTSFNADKWVRTAKETGMGYRSGGPNGLIKFCRQQAITAPRLPTQKSEMIWYSAPRKQSRFALAAMRAYAAGWRKLGRKGR
jgi:hypothetical protein